MIGNHYFSLEPAEVIPHLDLNMAKMHAWFCLCTTFMELIYIPQKTNQPKKKTTTQESSAFPKSF